MQSCMLGEIHDPFMASTGEICGNMQGNPNPAHYIKHQPQYIQQFTTLSILSKIHDVLQSLKKNTEDTD